MATHHPVSQRMISSPHLRVFFVHEILPLDLSSGKKSRYLKAQRSRIHNRAKAL